MRRLLPALCAGLLAVTATAQDSAPLPGAELRNGYAFDYPLILAQQRLFGIAHGVELLAAACRALPPEAAAVPEAAYALWRVRQEASIAAARSDLSEYYFGRADASAQEVARKLALKEALDLAPEQLEPACASLPEALQQPRYDLGARFHLEELMARAVAATETAARERACRPLFTGELLELHDVRYQLWQEINQPLLEQGNRELAEAWPPDAPAPTFEQWYAELQGRTQAGGRLAQCIDFSEGLKRPEAGLRNVFRKPAPLQSTPSPQ
ncbi:MAG TPA: hypothetical protein VF816_04255 [Rhodocyclaceae bacterium]